MKLRARFTAIGEDIDNLAVGDQVICPGGCVEEINISSRAVTKVPAAVDLNVAASFRNNYATAYYGLRRGMLKAGETLLVHGAAGGVGLASVDLGKLFGARVIATASADAKLDVVQSMGAETIGGIRPPHNARSPTLGVCAAGGAAA